MMIRRWCSALFFLFAVCCGITREAAACSCPSSGPPCQAAWNADAIFAGTVRSIDVAQEQADGGTRVVEIVIHFEVERPFVNATAGPIQIVAAGLSTCDYRFNRGEKYLVYATRRRDDGRLMAGICSRTRPLAEAAEDLKFLSALPASGTGARIHGRVNEWVHHPADESGVDHGPLANVTVNVRGATFSRDLITDTDGAYELTGVPLGSVSISVMAPFGVHGGGPHDFEVKDLRACVAADFLLSAESSAHGVVVDAAGRPAPGVTVEAVAEELAGYQPNAIHQPARTDERGHFSFDRLPPGAYVFGVNITKGQYKPPSDPAIFLPGTSIARAAAVFELKPGNRTDVGVLRLTRQ